MKKQRGAVGEPPWKYGGGGDRNLHCMFSHRLVKTLVSDGSTVSYSLVVEDAVGCPFLNNQHFCLMKSKMHLKMHFGVLLVRFPLT